jgi:hypothetical protein
MEATYLDSETPHSCKAASPFSISIQNSKNPFIVDKHRRFFSLQSRTSSLGTVPPPTCISVGLGVQRVVFLAAPASSWGHQKPAGGLVGDNGKEYGVFSVCGTPAFPPCSTSQGEFERAERVYDGGMVPDLRHFGPESMQAVLDCYVGNGE